MTAQMTAQKFTFRPATQGDLPQIVAIYNQSVLTKQATADLQSVSVADKQAWFDGHSNKRPLWVAICPLTGTLLGWGSLTDLYSRPAYHISAEISVYIDETAKGQGVGRALVEQLLDIAPSCGIEQMLAKIFAHNEPSLALFKKLGFAEWGYLKQVCDMQGFIADVVIVGKSLK